jgi:hypothetical protein
MRLTPTPEALRCGPGSVSIDHAHPRATAFAVLRGSVVALARRSTHTFIFNALRAVGESATAPPITQARLQSAGAQAVYDDFGVSFFPSLPSPEALAWFVQGSPRELGQRRALTLAGRAWTNVVIDGQQTSVLSWWVPRQAVPASTIVLVGRGLGLCGPSLLEFSDLAISEAHLFHSAND